MKPFLNDVWHDLREKRMWPVVLLLAVALVALPVAVLQPASEVEPAPTPGATAAPNPAEQAIVALAEDAGVDVSALDAFRSKDPFAGAPKPATEAPGEQAQTSAPPAGSGGAAGGESKDGSGGSPLGQGNGNGKTPTGPTGPPAQVERKVYTYTVSVRFGRKGRIRAHDSVERMEMLPSDKNPLLVFLGVTTSGKTAVFLVDSGLDQRGEGICRPRPTRTEPGCNFLYLRADTQHDQHYFTDVDGRRYDIRLTKINLVTTDELEKARESRRQQAEDGGDSSASRAPSFELPVFADSER